MTHGKPPIGHWFRFRLRTLFVITTLCCLVLMAWILKTRREEFHRKMSESSERPARVEIPRLPGLSPTEHEFLADAENAWYQSLDRHLEEQHRKYAYAYDHPWLPVTPDPHSPERPFHTDEEMILYLKQHGLR